MAQASIIGDIEDNELKIILIRNAMTGCVWLVFLQPELHKFL